MAGKNCETDIFLNLSALGSFLVLFVLSGNFLAFTLGTDVKMKSRVLGPTLTFGILQLFMFMIGWGIARLLAPLMETMTIGAFHAIVLFIGIKRIFRFFTVKKESRNFQIVHVFDAISLAIAVGVDALIMGLGFGIAHIPYGRPLIFLFLLTVLMALIGIGYRRKYESNNNGKNVELVSGVFMLAIGVLLMINIWI